MINVLQLVYQHWAITCILLVFIMPFAYFLAVALGGFVLRLRSGK